jgi:DNA-binding NarL/FixJ family response regulator/class 3 adenylate cyclase
VSSLPTGNVTLLFSDIESSTRLVQELGDAYTQVLSDHRRLIRNAVAEAGGNEVDCRADEFFVAFAEAEAALAATVAAQRAIAAEAWPEGTAVRVRMGMHTGRPVLADDTYYGIDVHRAARICRSGHGGQVLVSGATREALYGADLGGAELRDLGEHELKGLTQRERIFQVVADGLETSFPALREADLGATAPATIDAPVDAAAPAPASVDGSGERPLRVALAEDSVLLREGIARLLGDAGFEVVAQAGTADDLVRLVAMHKPDVAITDIRMPPTQTDEGLQAARKIRERQPEVGVLVLSQYVEPAYAMTLLEGSAEGVGYLLKDRVSDIEEFTSAVRRVAQGGSVLDPAVVSQLVGRRRKADPIDELTPREREVLGLMAEGRSNDAISQRLFITLRAVEKHVTSIFSKLGLTATPEDHRRVLAVLTFLRQ